MPRQEKTHKNFLSFSLNQFSMVFTHLSRGMQGSKHHTCAALPQETSSLLWEGALICDLTLSLTGP